MTHKLTVADILSFINKIAPFSAAEKWDNSGLQVGEPGQTVTKIWIALDPLPSVISAACEQSADLLITHHPLIFHPLRSINTDSVVGNILLNSITNRLSIIAAHTNLDSYTGGINDLLAEKIGLKHIKMLDYDSAPNMVKLVVFVPPEHELTMLEELLRTSTGKIGTYSCCSFRTKGLGTFKPGLDSSPFTGTIGEISHSPEVRIEIRVQRQDLGSVIAALRQKHPYQTMAYDVFPVDRTPDDPLPNSGLGRIGELEHPLSLSDLAKHIKNRLNLQWVKFAGNPDLQITRTALCCGSGSSLMPKFFASNAQVFISGDLRYHDARDAENSGRGLIDIGHFGSEHIIIEHLAQKLRKFVEEQGVNIEIQAYHGETDPFILISTTPPTRGTGFHAPDSMNSAEHRIIRE